MVSPEGLPPDQRNPLKLNKNKKRQASFLLNFKFLISLIFLFKLFSTGGGGDGGGRGRGEGGEVRSSPPAKQPFPLSHIYIWRLGRGEAWYAGGERIEEWSIHLFTFYIKRAACAGFVHPLYLFRRERWRTKKKKKKNKRWGKRRKELLRSPNKFILNLYVFYCAEPGSWFAGENYRSW